MAEMFTRYDRPVLDGVVPGDYFIAVFQDPVDHFAALWDAVNAELDGGAVPVDVFLASPEKYTSQAAYDQLKPNPQLYDVLGVRAGMQPNAMIQRLDASFRLVRLYLRLFLGMPARKGHVKGVNGAWTWGPC